MGFSMPAQPSQPERRYPLVPSKAGDAVSAANGDARRPAAGRRRWWLGGAAVLLVAAIAGSVLGAAAWQRALERDRAHAFKAEATGVGSAVATSIQRVRDLTGTIAAMYK